MSQVRFPAGWRLERLRREHRRREFRCGQTAVDDWLATKALQHQEKHLSVTKLLLDDRGAIAGCYTLAAAQVDFGDLPAEVSRHLPRRSLPVVVLAWLGVGSERQGVGLGRKLLAQALEDCWDANQAIPFVAVVLDCIDDSARAFYQRFGFTEIPWRPYRLFLSTKRLAAMMGDEVRAP
jgi:GNAT superfamily N-acetyltransferase